MSMKIMQRRIIFYVMLLNTSCKLMYFGKNYFDRQYVLHRSNCSKIDYIEQCVHSGTTFYSAISISIINNEVNDLFMRTTNLMADVSNAHSRTLSVLYNTYCMTVYGFQLWCFNDYKSVKRFYIAWRKRNRII